MINRSDFRDAHISPHTLDVASMFSVMSRLTESSKVSLLTKMKIYNGEDVIEKGRVKKIDIRDLREESRGEGMKGISTRFIMKCIDAALTDSDSGYITPISVIESIKKQESIAISTIDDLMTKNKSLNTSIKNEDYNFRLNLKVEEDLKYGDSQIKLYMDEHDSKKKYCPSFNLPHICYSKFQFNICIV